MKNTLTLGLPFASIVWLVIRMIIISIWLNGLPEQSEEKTSGNEATLYLFFSMQLSFCALEIIVYLTIGMIHRRAMYTSLDDDDVEQVERHNENSNIIAPYGKNQVTDASSGVALNTALANVSALAREFDDGVRVDKRRCQRASDDLLSAARAHAANLTQKEANELLEAARKLANATMALEQAANAIGGGDGASAASMRQGTALSSIADLLTAARKLADSTSALHKSAQQSSSGSRSVLSEEEDTDLRRNPARVRKDAGGSDTGF